ncbi:MAG: hypothetical protein ACLP50_27685 [Solirubrobacteraceae bacterium]
MGGRSLTAFGFTTLVVLVLGLVALIVGSSGLQIAGLVVIVFVALAFVADYMSGSRMSGDTGGFSILLRGRAPISIDPIGPRSLHPDTQPEYIQEAGHPSEQAWEHEQELYRLKEEEEASERPGGADD